MIHCAQCHHDVPELDYCVRCGFALGVTESEVPNRRAGRRRFAAAPREHSWAPHVDSTLFPQLPETDLRLFAVAWLIGGGAVVGLTLAGLFPLALSAACLLVPTLLSVYMYAVDLYEDEPARVLVLTALWGALVGVALGFALLHVDVPIGSFGLAFGDPHVLELVVVVPLAGGILALAGPVALLRYRRFNDVLDGATFGAVSGVYVAGMTTLVQAWPLVSAGFRPRGATAPRIIELAELGVLVPIIWAGAIGTAAAALWLRYRAPLRDRRALGPFGSPPVAFVAAGGLLVAAPAAVQAWGQSRAFVVLVALAALSLVLMRRAIHLGLLEEADETEIGDSVVCANCSRPTPRHTFCGHCGIALRALPKATPTIGTAETATEVAAT